MDCKEKPIYTAYQQTNKQQRDKRDHSHNKIKVNNMHDISMETK